MVMKPKEQGLPGSGPVLLTSSFPVFSYFSRPPRVVRSPGGPSLSKQSFKDECDINVIVKRWATTGEIPPSSVNPRLGMFAEVCGVDGLLDAFLVVQAAQEGMAALPAAVRDRFQNDPARILEFVSDPANRDEAVKLGLLEGPAPVVGPPTSEPARAGDSAAVPPAMGT